jgi:alpha-glucosidase
LYLRWFQLAAFLPFFRTYEIWVSQHREPWEFGEPYLSILRDFLRLRYALLPYWYTLAWKAHHTGHPLVRPLFWCDPADKNLWEVDDEFLVGDNLLVAPVTQDNSRSRQVILPQGRWYSFWNDAGFDGPARVAIETPLERIGLFVRAGTVLPMEENGNLILHLYPGEGDSQLYSDAGDGYGDWRVDKFQLTQDMNHLKLNWQSDGDYPFPHPRVQLVLHAWQAKRAWRDGEEIAVKDNRIDVEPFKQARIECAPP